MASCCLLIETYVSFIQPTFVDTTGKSERCFGWFFNTEEKFFAFLKGGLTVEEYLNVQKKINNKGLPCDFYKNVRCGILHNGETKNGWKIRRTGDLFIESGKQINATKFLEELNKVLIEFQCKLLDSDFNSPIWKNYLNRLSQLIKKS